MSERFQKTFISAREFLESWDKEIYEMTNLDYFIFLLVNHLGNQLDRRFFKRLDADAALSLNFEGLGNLCFNLGDSFEYFLDEDYLETPASVFGLDGFKKEHSAEEDENQSSKRAQRLQSLLNDHYNHPGQILPVDLFHHSVFDTLLQFYYEEKGIEFDEDDIDLIELSEFIVEETLDFIQSENESLLKSPGEPAINRFEGWLANEENYPEEERWAKNEDAYEMDGQWGDVSPYYEDISQVIQKFLNDRTSNPSDVSGCITCDIELFEEYLTEHAGITNIYELQQEHLLEFMSVSLVKQFAQQPETSFGRIFQNMARFITWLANHYEIDLKRSFLKHYESVKTDLPRVVRTLNRYLSQYDLFEVMLTRDDGDQNQLSGFFEVERLNKHKSGTCDLVNIQLNNSLEGVCLDAPVRSRLKNGDILQATLIHRNNHWEVLEIHYIFPAVALPFVY